jgi:hypothetical protein
MLQTAAQPYRFTAKHVLRKRDLAALDRPGHRFARYEVTWRRYAVAVKIADKSVTAIRA